MSEIKVLRAQFPPVARTPQCEASIRDQLQRPEWRQKRYSVQDGEPLWQCRRIAAVSIDGKCYCRPHAGLALLDERLKEIE